MSERKSTTISGIISEMICSSKRPSVYGQDAYKGKEGPIGDIWRSGILCCCTTVVESIAPVSQEMCDSRLFQRGIKDPLVQVSIQRCLTLSLESRVLYIWMVLVLCLDCLPLSYVLYHQLSSHCTNF